jgi:uncharacterized cupin superfamily protein
MQRTVVEGVRLWSVWQPDRNLFFNSFFVQSREGGNLAVDPLPLDAEGVAEITAAGGLAFVVVTNRDHERDARALASTFGAKLAASALDAPLLSGPVDRVLADGEELLDAVVVPLEGLKTAGEFALHLRGREAVIVGDALWGDPAGSLRLMPDAKLADPPKAALSLRRIAALRPKHLLVGDGACIFGDATRALWACLEARTDVYVNKINVDEAIWSGSPRAAPSDGNAWTDLDFEIGAERLGFRVARMAVGAVFAPMHWHSAEEELFVVLEGSPSLLTPRGNMRLRKGDYVAFPTRASGAHKLLNDGDGPCEVLMVANVDADDVCYYPDSRKLLIEKADLILRDHPALDYMDGEV